MILYISKYLAFASQDVEKKGRRREEEKKRRFVQDLGLAGLASNMPSQQHNTFADPQHNPQPVPGIAMT